MNLPAMVCVQVPSIVNSENLCPLLARGVGCIEVVDDPNVGPIRRGPSEWSMGERKIGNSENACPFLEVRMWL